MGRASRKKNEGGGEKKSLPPAMVMRFPGHVDKVDACLLEEFPEHAKTIALIIATWSQIEFNLSLFLAASLRADRGIIQPMIYAIESSGARMEAIRTALLRIYPGEKAAKFIGDLMAEASQLLVQRNKYAHAYYGQIDEPKELALIGLHEKRKTTVVPLHDLAHQYERMKKLSHRTAVLVAAEMQLPLGGPGAADTIPQRPPELRRRDDPSIRFTAR